MFPSHARHFVRAVGAFSVAHVAVHAPHVFAHLLAIAVDFGREFVVAVFVEVSKAHAEFLTHFIN